MALHDSWAFGMEYRWHNCRHHFVEIINPEVVTSSLHCLAHVNPMQFLSAENDVNGADSSAKW
jgi:hypothetical protein